MKLVNYKITAQRDEVMSVIRDNTRVVEAEKYDTSRGKPRMHITEKGERVKIKCEMTERPTKDNGFLEGTYFIGKVKEREGVTSVKGVILTCPIYHTIFFLLFAFFVAFCFIKGGISPIPFILVAFDIVMFYGEFKKQSLIKRYIFRTMKIVYKTKNPIKIDPSKL